MNKGWMSNMGNYPAFVISDLLFLFIIERALSHKRCVPDAAGTLLIHYGCWLAQTLSCFGENTVNVSPTRAKHVQIPRCWALSYSNLLWPERKGYESRSSAGMNTIQKKRPVYVDKVQISFSFMDDSLQDYICNFLCGLIWLSLAKLAYPVPPTPFTTSSSSWDSSYPIKCLSKSTGVTGHHGRLTEWKILYGSPSLKSGVCLNVYNVHSILASCLFTVTS